MITIVPECPYNSGNESFSSEAVIFPDETSQVFLPRKVTQLADSITIRWDFEGEREIIDLVSIVTGLRNFCLHLELPYLPYARQDKKVTYKNASTFNLAAFATVINALRFDEVLIHEPHNIEATQRLIQRSKIVKEPFVHLPNGKADIETIVFPDAGAYTRYHTNEELQSYLHMCFQKVRDQETGKITSTLADMEEWVSKIQSVKPTLQLDKVSFHFHIVDDLVDGGRSFTECSRYITEWLSHNKHVARKNIKITLEVIHGVLSKGLPIPNIDHTWCHHRLRHPCNQNILLHTDGYKLAHMEQYPPGTRYIYSYMIARSSKKYECTSFFGLQYLLLNYLQGRVTQKMVDEFCKTRESLMGPTPDHIRKQMQQLVSLQYIPLRIKAIPEGSAVNLGNVLVTVTNTHPDFFWLVGLVESLLLKVWYSSTVATYSRKLRQLCEDYSKKSCDQNDHVAYQIHDFGYRGAATEETAALGGASHLVHSKGTDTVSSIAFVKKWYDVTSKESIGATVPGTEHSVMSSYGRDDEIGAFKRILDLYPSGNVSIVSDTYNYWNVLTEILPLLKDQITSRTGKLIIRPDSGNPEKVLLGDPDIEDKNDPKALGTLHLLDRLFGSTVNEKGFKVLAPCVGVVYGDSMYYERINRILQGCMDLGYATSNMTFGVGGILLQNHSRDDLGFAFKATSIDIDGERKAIFKDPVTDISKRSHRGLLRLEHDQTSGQWTTYSDQTPEQESTGELRTVFEDGQVYRYDTFEDIQQRAISNL